MVSTSSKTLSYILFTQTKKFDLKFYLKTPKNTNKGTPKNTWQNFLRGHCPSPGPNGIKIFNPGISVTGRCKILGSQDFLGRDSPLFLGNFPGFLFLLCVLVKSHNFHQSLSLSLSPPQPSSSSPLCYHHWPCPPFSFIAQRKKRQNNCKKGFVCMVLKSIGKKYFYQIQKKG